MVPSAPPPARPAHPAQRELDRLATVLGLAKRSVLVEVRVKDAAHAGAIVACVRDTHPDARWCTAGVELLSLPTGSTAVAWLDPEDLPGLNLARERFRDEGRRVVFLATEAVSARFRQEAPDLYDWVAHRLDLVAVPPEWAVRAAAAAVTLGGRLAWWGPGAPAAVLAAVAPAWSVRVCAADAGWSELVACATTPGWRVYTGVRRAADEARVRWAEAGAGAAGAAVLDRPEVDLPGWWRVHAEVEGSAGPPAEADLVTAFEPEAQGRVPARLAEAPPWARVAADAAAVLAACRVTGPELRGVAGEAWEAARRELDARVAGGLGGWPAVIEMPAFGCGSGPVPGLAEATGRLSAYVRTFLVERRLRAGGPDRACVEAAIEARHLDIARAWLPSLPRATPEEQGWHALLTLLAESGEGVWTQREALAALWARASGGGLRAAIARRLAEARLDALELPAAEAVMAEAERGEVEPWRRAEFALLRRRIADLALEPAVGAPPPGEDAARTARFDVLRAAELESIGQRAESRRMRSQAEERLATLLVEPAGKAAPPAGIEPHPAGVASPLRRLDVLAAAATEQADDAVVAALERLRGEYDVRAVRVQLALAHWLRSADDPEPALVAAAGARLRSELGESSFLTAAGPAVAAVRARAELERGDVASARETLVSAWEACAPVTNPEARALLVVALASVTRGTPDPRLPRWLEAALAVAERYADAESAGVKPRLVHVARDALAEARAELHRARSLRRAADVERWQKQERALARVVEGAG